MQATNTYSDGATVKEYNKGLDLMKAGYTIYLVSSLTCPSRLWEPGVKAQGRAYNKLVFHVIRFLSSDM